jgi:hypothetical protein
MPVLGSVCWNLNAWPFRGPENYDRKTIKLTSVRDGDGYVLEMRDIIVFSPGIHRRLQLWPAPQDPHGLKTTTHPTAPFRSLESTQCQSYKSVYLDVDACRICRAGFLNAPSPCGHQLRLTSETRSCSKGHANSVVPFCSRRPRWTVGSFLLLALEQRRAPGGSLSSLRSSAGTRIMRR